MIIDNSTLYQVSPDMMNLSGAEVGVFNALLAEWQRHLGGNIRNEAYYRGKVRPVASDPDDPNELLGLSVVMGWGGKAVDTLANRSVLTSFEGDSAGTLGSALAGNDIVNVYEQAVTSELISSCSFLSVSKGRPGEPDVLVSAHSAKDAVALWDERRKRVRCGLVVNDIDVDESGARVPTWVTMYTDEYTYSARNSGGVWRAERAENPLGRPLLEPLRYRPSLTRPFGKSRISPTIRSLIDRALCVGARTEVTATFYTYPMRYMLGVDRATAQDMAKRKVETYADRFLFVSTNKNGDTPQLGQLSQANMQPHIEHLEMLGKQFASEASIPLDEVGIVFDNPTSSEAMYAAQQRLVMETEHVNRMNGAALRNIGLMALACANGSSSLDYSDNLSARFENPLRPSMAARADYAIKVNSAVQAYSMTRWFWRDLGYDETAIDGIMRDIRYAEAQRAAANAAAALAAQQAEPEAAGIEGPPEAV